MSEKEHVEKLKSSDFNRQRASTDTLRKNCKDGFIFSKKAEKLDPDTGKVSNSINAAGQSAFHHVLPITTLQDGNIDVTDDQRDYVHDCMAATKWDINDTPNLIGLPLKPVYEAADRKIRDSNIPLTHEDLLMLNPALEQFGSIPNLPCHQIDHPSFNEGVINYLNRNVWQKLKPSQPCQNKSEDIKELLDRGSKKFNSWLKARGKSAGGAAYCWVNRDKLPTTWYIPLSMKIGKPTPMTAPPKLPKKKQKDWLDNLFQRL